MGRRSGLLSHGSDSLVEIEYSGGGSGGGGGSGSISIPNVLGFFQDNIVTFGLLALSTGYAVQQAKERLFWYGGLVAITIIEKADDVVEVFFDPFSLMEPNFQTFASGHWEGPGVVRYVR